MRKSAMSEAVKHYFRTTTLHGFKYLSSMYCVDRIGWVVCCCASAWCAALLCTVLWSRFLQVPALLVLYDDTAVRARTAAHVTDRVPAVAVCLPTESVAEMFLDKLSPNNSETERIPIALARLLIGRSAARDQLLLLDELLTKNNVTLPQVMMEYTPNCSQHTKKCRYQNIMVPCEQLFKKELTTWGLCCVMQPNKLRNISMGLVARLHTTQMLEFVLQCTYGSKLYGCQFVTIYEGEEWMNIEPLSPGYYYMAQLRFVAIAENTNTDNLVENTCVHDKSYSRTVCMLKCAERACGCSDPLHSKYADTNNDLPICPATRLGCLRANEYKEYENVSCHCLPSCRTITTNMVLESSQMNVIKQSIDPLYSGLNVTTSTVINLRVYVGQSRVFMLNPTETWLTLLSSLGGVFNMFLGVGVFSALEFLYLIIVKLPIAIRKSIEIDPITA